jgi:phosphoglycerate dehydrogenase-like enzyme
MRKVYIVDSAEVPHGPDAELESQVLAGCAEVQLLFLNQEAEFAPYISEADAIILWHHLSFGPESIGLLTERTRIIVRNGVGYDNVDAAGAAAKGIAVANVPDYGTEEVADHAITLALALVRQIRPLLTDGAAGRWEWRTALACRRLRDLTFGVVGCGRIGTATALRARALGFRTVFYDPYVAVGYDKAIGVSRASTLDELLEQADIVSLHTPLNDETRHLIDGPQLRKMKQGAYLVNTARGGVACHAAVVEALEAGKLGGAGLDVLENEPQGMEELLRVPNVIVTPHSAFYSQESLLEMRRKSAEIVRDVLLEGRFRNVVNQPVRRGMGD